MAASKFESVTVAELLGDLVAINEKRELADLVKVWLLRQRVEISPHRRFHPLRAVVVRHSRITQEYLAWASHQVAALIFELRFTFGHLVPDASQRVIGQEFDYVARREELVAHGQLAAVARRGGFVAHLFALFF